MLPGRVTAAAIESEIEAAREWAKCEQMELQAVIPETLVRAVFTREVSGDQFFLQGKFDGYKALPPEWSWCNSDWSDSGNKRLSPEGAPTPYGGSIFLNHGGRAVICAPFKPTGIPCAWRPPQ